LDALVNYLSQHIDKFQEQVKDNKMLFLWLCAEVELKFGPVLTLQREQANALLQDKKGKGWKMKKALKTLY